MTDFLLELRSEEIPARMQDDARQNLKRLFEFEIAKAGLRADDIATFATPRRLALVAYGLPLENQATSEELKGPKVNAPSQALEGFLRKAGIAQDGLVVRNGVYFAVIEKARRATSDILADAIDMIVRTFPWPKSMRWGPTSVSTEMTRWVRPLQGIVALFGENVVRCHVADVLSDHQTTGHRFLHTGTITINRADAGEYEDKLRKAYVIVNQEERREIIRTGTQRAADDAELILVQDSSLVDENAGLTEWPVPLLGHFDPAFLDVPPEVIQLTARVNQKYFVMRDAGGRLAPNFICVANIDATDGGRAIVAGNERVLSARLSDAKFFWDNDLKIRLDTQAEKLSQIVFHEKLGTVADKVERVAKLARWLCEEGIVKPRSFGDRVGVGDVPTQTLAPVGAGSPHPNPSPEREGLNLADLAERAARICKADLVTGMVGEFPELQGIIGGYLAKAQGEGPQVAAAIRDHYKPAGQGDEVPVEPVTVAVSLADKLDTLTRFFLINEPPTGSKDPFALRRAALGVIAMILANNLRFRLQDALIKAVKDDFAESEQVFYGSVEEGLASFFADRLKVQQREAGVRHDLIDAVFALGSEGDLVRLLARVKALQAFVGTADGADLLIAYKRAANILKQAGDVPFLHRDNLLPIESALLHAIDDAATRTEREIAREDFEAAMAALAALRAPIDAFFEGIMVNDPDPQVRTFRLGLLARFRDAVHKVADFSKIEG